MIALYYQWKPNQFHLARRRGNDPEKLALAARLRTETTLSIKRIPERVGLGSSKSANGKLQTWRPGRPKSSCGTGPAV